MIYLTFPEHDAQIKHWQERLESFIVDYKMEQVPALEQPVIDEGAKKHVGEKAIEEFLIKLEAELNDWRTHRCGV